MSATSAEDIPFNSPDAELPPQVYTQGPGTLECVLDIYFPGISKKFAFIGRACQLYMDMKYL